MKCLLFLIACLACVFAHPLEGITPEDAATNVWVVLAAGSTGWSNYRHQADVCHMYQVARRMGVPDSRIIVFMRDDLASNPSNPKKGSIINEPKGPNVYPGVPKDYTGGAVSGANFLKVLEGVKPGSGSGKVLQSTANDHVFVFFSDHGTSNAICWPEGCSVTASKFEATLNTMSQKKMFKRLVVYIEACYAGSMFYRAKIPPNVYITTASPIAASSFAYNWDNTLRAYLADIYSWLFIHDLEVNSLTRTFNNQIAYVQNNIQNYSTVCQYGDYGHYGSTKLTDFWKPTALFDPSDTTERRIPRITDAVPMWDVPYESARKIYELSPTDESLMALKKEEKFRMHVDAMADRILNAMDVEGFLLVPACTTCDKSKCKCLQSCSGSTAHCNLMCCNTQGCYKASSPLYDADAHETCTSTVVGEFLAKCGTDHDYLRSVDAKLHRACLGKPNIEAALRAIDAECSRDMH